MLFTHKLRLGVSPYAYLETALIVSGFLLIGYLIEPKDPFLLNYEITYILVLMTVVTLFHGINNGLFATFLLAVGMQLFYPHFPTETFLKIFVLVLVFGEFHYYWNRKILQNSSKNAYLNNKLDELSNAFYTLKISHDQLEKNYVFKPMSLRNSIRLLKESHTQGKDYYENFLTLLEKSFSVREAELCLVFNERLYSVYDKKREHEISSDPMIEMALGKKSPIYVSSEEVENNSRYLAVIPAISEERVKGMLLIKEMPFLSFNKDTLISISILIAYFLDELEKWEIIGRNLNKNLSVDDEFYFELMRLHKIYEEFDVNSTILVVRSEDKLLSHLILEKTRENLRSLDIVSAHRAGSTEVMGILFPFADRASAQGFLTRLFRLLKRDINDSDIEHSFFNISELQSIRRYAKIEENDA